MNSPFKLVKCLSHCVRVMRHRASHHFSARRAIAHHSSGRVWASFSSIPMKDRYASSRGFHDDRYDWRDGYQGRVQSGMDARYEQPKEMESTPRYDDAYFNQPHQVVGDIEHEGFDPRFDQRLYKQHSRNEERQRMEAQRRFEGEVQGKKNRDAQYPTQPQPGDGYMRAYQETESRRRVAQDSNDHQKRQERIIEENKRKWQNNRPEPTRELKAPGVTYKFDHPIYGAEKITDPPAKKERKQRTNVKEDTGPKRMSVGRAQRLKEVKKQERQLRESRKDYKLPKAEADSEPLYNENWHDRRARSEEAKYWHSWRTCPDERRQLPESEDLTDLPSFDHAGDQRRGFVQPQQPYDGTRKSYHTTSWRPAARAQLAEELAEEEWLNQYSASVMPPPPKFESRLKFRPRRKLSGMDKQVNMIWNFNRSDKADAGRKTNRQQKRPLLQSHVFAKPLPLEMRGEREPITDLELPQQPPRQRMQWNGLPRPVTKRLEMLRQWVADEEEEDHQESTQQPSSKIQPPRFRMSIKSKSFKRMRVPVQSFSERLAVKPGPMSRSEYAGYTPSSVSERWQNYGKTQKRIF